MKVADRVSVADIIRATKSDVKIGDWKEGAIPNATVPVRISLSEALIPALPHYTVDVVVRADSGNIAAIFPATNDVSVLRAVLFSMGLPKHNVKNIVPFLIYENLDGGRSHSKAARSHSILTLLPQCGLGGEETSYRKLSDMCREQKSQLDKFKEAARQLDTDDDDDDERFEERLKKIVKQKPDESKSPDK